MPNLRSWVLGRVKAIVDAGHGAALAASWPQDVPTLKQSDAHTEDDLNVIASVLTEIEARHRMPFGSPDPRLPEAPKPAYAEVAEPAPLIDEGGMAEMANVADLQVAYDNLPPEGQALVDFFTSEAKECGVSVSLATRPTVRRVHIARALIALAPFSVAEACDLLARVTRADDGAPLGQVVGTLGVEAAMAVCFAVEELSHLTNEQAKAG